MEETIVSPETNEEVVTSQEEQPVEEATEEDSKTPTLEDYYALEKKNKELFERAKKAEIAAKELKAKPLPDNKPNENDALFKDKLVLIAQGEKPEVVDEAEVIAKAKGIPLKEALEYPTIKSFKDALLAKEKSEKAQLGASGSGSSSPSVDPYTTVGESEEEHRKRFEAELKKRGLK